MTRSGMPGQTSLDRPDGMPTLSRSSGQARTPRTAPTLSPRAQVAMSTHSISTSQLHLRTRILPEISCNVRPWPRGQGCQVQHLSWWRPPWWSDLLPHCLCCHTALPARKGAHTPLRGENRVQQHSPMGIPPCSSHQHCHGHTGSRLCGLLLAALPRLCWPLAALGGQQLGFSLVRGV